MHCFRPVLVVMLLLAGLTSCERGDLGYIATNPESGEWGGAEDRGLADELSLLRSSFEVYSRKTENLQAQVRQLRTEYIALSMRHRYDVLVLPLPVYVELEDRNYRLALSLLEDGRISEVLNVTKHLVSKYALHGSVDSRDFLEKVDDAQRRAMYSHSLYLRGLAYYVQGEYRASAELFELALAENASEVKGPALIGVTFSYARAGIRKRACRSRNRSVKSIPQGSGDLERFLSSGVIKSLNC